MNELEKLAVVNTNKGLAERFSDLVDTIHVEFNRRMTKAEQEFLDIENDQPSESDFHEKKQNC